MTNDIASKNILRPKEIELSTQVEDRLLDLKEELRKKNFQSCQLIDGMGPLKKEIKELRLKELNPNLQSLQANLEEKRKLSQNIRKEMQDIRSEIKGLHYNRNFLKKFILDNNLSEKDTIDKICFSPFLISHLIKNKIRTIKDLIELTEHQIICLTLNCKRYKSIIINFIKDFSDLAILRSKKLNQNVYNIPKLTSKIRGNYKNLCNLSRESIITCIGFTHSTSVFFQRIDIATVQDLLWASNNGFEDLVGANSNQIKEIEEFIIAFRCMEAAEEAELKSLM